MVAAAVELHVKKAAELTAAAAANAAHSAAGPMATTQACTAASHVSQGERPGRVAATVEP
jgi:hypothetical protein